jgi:hypothetical protein
VALLNGELGGFSPDEHIRQTSENILETLTQGIAAIAAAYAGEEGRVIESPKYPDFDSYRGRPSDWVKDFMAARGEHNEHLAAIDKLNRLLSESPVTQSLVPTLTRGGNTVGWKLEEEYENPRDRIGGIALQELIKLARFGLLDRIRRCGCGRWFFAKRGNQAAHDGRCRKQKYERGSRDKNGRREYMRWYYMMYQSPNAPRKKLSFQQWQKQSKRTKRGR